MSESNRAWPRVGAARRRTPLRPPALLWALALIALPALAAGCAGQSTTPTAPTPTVSPTLPAVPSAMPASLAALSSQAPAIRFAHLPPDSGLSQSVVTAFLQDDQGFLWLGTQDGLNRYDGASFKVFRDDPNDPGGLRGNLVTALAKGPGGDVWVGTNDGGLSRYDPASGGFASYPNDPADPNTIGENSVVDVALDQAGTVWVATSNSGLNRLDPATGQVTRYLHDPADPASLSADSLSSLALDGQGGVWVGTVGGGACRLDPASGCFTCYGNDPDDPGSLSSNIVQSLYMDREGMLWAGTFEAGLNRLDPASGRAARYLNEPDDPTSLSHNTVVSVLEDHTGRLWVATQGGGLNLLDRTSGRFTRFQHDPVDPDSLSIDSITTVFEDDSGIIWFGAFGTGADYYDPYRDKFLLVRSRPGDANGLSSSSIWAILEDDRGTLWVATHGGGLNRFDPQTGAWRHYRHDPADPQSIDDDVVYAVYQDSRGTLWVGTAQGLNRFDAQRETFAHSINAPIMAIYEDRQGGFWVGTGVGLISLDRDAGEGYLMQNDPRDPGSLSSNTVDLVFEDDQDRLWVGTINGGLNLLDRETGRFTRFTSDPEDPDSLSSNIILAMHQARDGTLWVGTSGGLNRFDPERATFSAYRKEDGLPSDHVYGILEDEQGGLWLSTNKGLSRFDPRTQSFKNYDRSDGLQDDEFNQFAYSGNKEGVMYFGGVNGFNAFHPGLVQDNPFVPPVVITALRVYNRPVPVGPGSPLAEPIEASHEICLSYTDGFFELDYAALHYSSPGEIRYAYIMEGLDREWNLVGNRHFASYTNVPPGDYVFRVRATNADGVWNEAGASLRMIIPPPFWQTTWFRLLVALAVIGGISGAFFLRIHSVEAQRRQLERQVDERTRDLRETMGALERAKEAAEAASRAKSVFLANMSHEFRTPLNAILGFTQIMTRDRRLSPDQKEDVAIVHRSSEHLLGLINDVLEMSKIEAGRSSLRLRAFDLYQMLEGLEEMFALRAEGKGLALSLVLAPDVPRYVKGDEGKLRQVLMNLLGNAVKFTEEGHVALSVSVQQSAVSGQPTAASEQLATAGGGAAASGTRNTQHVVRFAVEDTGPGIAAQELAEIFVPFVQAQSGREAQEGTGLGLAISQQYARLMGGEIRVQSEPGRGSTFELLLRLEAASAGDLEVPPPTRRVIGLEPGQPAYRILVVDDQEVNRRLIVRLFEPLGFEVCEAANGEEALAVWESWAPHLIWMDMRMPVMDGYEATRRIKATTCGMATIVIALTASALEEDRAVILSEGCDDYMRKPFREEELFAAVARHLGARFVYEPLAEEAEPPTATRAPADAAALVARLRPADPAWIDALERAATLGDQEALQRLAGQVAARDPALAEEINRLAAAFDHDRILASIHEARDGSDERHE